MLSLPDWLFCCTSKLLGVFPIFEILVEKKSKKVQLSEFFDVSEFQIGDNKKYERHDSQSHVILPQAPAGVLYSQVVQILLPCASKKNPQAPVVNSHV